MPHWKHRRRLVYGTVMVCAFMLTVGAFDWTDRQVSSQLVIGAVSLWTIVLTSYVLARQSTTVGGVMLTSSYLISVKRTAAQAAAALVVAQAARAGIDLPGDALSDLFFTGLFVVYYAVYRVVEQKYPQLLKLLGSGAQPVYVDPSADRDDAESDEDA